MSDKELENEVIVILIGSNLSYIFLRNIFTYKYSF